MPEKNTEALYDILLLEIRCSLFILYSLDLKSITLPISAIYNNGVLDVFQIFKFMENPLASLHNIGDDACQTYRKQATKKTKWCR